MKRKKIVLPFVLATLLALGSPVLGAEYPVKPITLVIPLSPGGVIDVIGQSLAEVAKKDFGQPVIRENKPGGGGTIGTQWMVQKPADGYTLTFVATNNLNINWHMREMGFHPINDVTHIIRITNILSGIVVRSDSPWKTIQEFIQYTKQNPKSVSYGSPGVGTPPHLAMEELAIVGGGIQWLHIPYKGAAETNTALLGGHVDATVGATVWVPLVDAGKFRLLASIAPFRFTRYPHIPTLKDIGYDVAYPSPIDIIGPKGLPKAVVKKLHDAFKMALESHEVQATLKKYDMFATYLNSEDLEKATQREFEQIGRIVQKLGLQKK